MSLARALGVAVVALWFIVASVFALSDISILLDPVSRRAQHVCADEAFKGHRYPGFDVSDKECFPRLATRAGLDALMVGLPTIVGLVLAGGRSRR